MRIISGKYRGKKLFSPLDLSIRPTADRAKEALFSILRSRLGVFSDCCFLDVFSGSGSVGLEAFSQGFKSVCLIDMDIQILNKNTKLFNDSNINVMRADATKLPQAKQLYDVVFLDAPYNKGLSQKALLSLKSQNWLAENCLVVVELEKTEDLEDLSDFTLLDERIYGLTKFIFLSVK